MNSPGRDSRSGMPLTPARRSRERPSATPPPAADASPTPAYDDTDVQRGLAAAVLGTLGRMQLRLEAVSRQQTEGFAELHRTLVSLDQRLAALESTSRPVVATPPTEATPASPLDPRWVDEDVP